MLRAHMHECEIFLFLALDSATSPVPRSVTSQTSLSKDQCTVPGNIPHPQAITELYTEPYWSDLVFLYNKNSSSLTQILALEAGDVAQW